MERRELAPLLSSWKEGGEGEQQPVEWTQELFLQIFTFSQEENAIKLFSCKKKKKFVLLPVLFSPSGRPNRAGPATTGRYTSAERERRGI